MRDEEVHVWTGTRWSKTSIVQGTAPCSFMEVTLDNGSMLSMGESHVWPTVSRNETVELSTYQLEAKDALVEFSLPMVDHGTAELPDAYMMGYRSNDDTPESASFIPDNGYTLESRLKWLSGVIDAEGYLLYDAGYNLILSSDSSEYVTGLRLMLQELGQHSLVRSYHSTWVLSIPDFALIKLKEMGLNPQVVNCELEKLVQGELKLDCSVSVAGGQYTGRQEIPYWFTEPTVGLAVYAGVLCGARRL